VHGKRISVAGYVGAAGSYVIIKIAYAENKVKS
jgi:hypothetical protein